VWSTKRPGDPASIGHRMTPDAHGRPTTPFCGLTTEGLWFRRDHDWGQGPEPQRCRGCEQLGTYHEDFSQSGDFSGELTCSGSAS